MRIFAAALALEANTFLTLPTSYQSFLDKLHYPPGTHPETPSHQTAPLWVARRRAAVDGFELIEGTCYAAQPGGKATRHAYETMRDEILGQLQAAMPVDGVVLGLHGSMVAEGYDDCEGDLLERARAIVGPNCVIGIELDPHCALTVKRCALADIIILFKEYPHTDFVERGEELLTLVQQAIRGEIKPVKSVWDCRTLANFPTSVDPMRSYVDRIMGMEGKNGILSISVGHSFSHCDVPETTARILVITNDAKDYGDELAQKLGRELIGMRESAQPAYYDVDGAIDYALSRPGPVIIADTCDNAGGGAPSDNTTFIRRLMERGVESAAIGPVWDPMAVRFAFDAGEGARMMLRFGGKCAVESGLPIDAEVEIVSCVKNSWQTFAGSKVPMGDAAAIRFNGIEVALISTRAQAMGSDLFTNLGVDLASKQIIVVKSSQHFYASYSKVGTEVIYAQADGPLRRDKNMLNYQKIQRPIWPLDDISDGYKLI